MRAVGLVAAIALTLVAGSAAADDSSVPSQRDVHDARVAARDQARDVATVQVDLALANQRLQQSAVRAAQAAEAWNGARFRLARARDAAADAEERSAIAVTDVERQQDTYADALVTSYQLAPTLNGVAAILRSDGIETVVERTTTLQGAEEALDGQYDEFRAASTLADVATQQALEARAEARRLQAEARQARDAAGRCRRRCRRRGRRDSAGEGRPDRRARPAPGHQPPPGRAPPVRARGGRCRSGRAGRCRGGAEAAAAQAAGPGRRGPGRAGGPGARGAGASTRSDPAAPAPAAAPAHPGSAAPADAGTGTRRGSCGRHCLRPRPDR